MAYSALSQHHDARFPESLADVRGYEVRTRDDDDKVGRVSDLVCTPDGQIRYLDVDLGGFFNPRNVVVPIGAAQVDRERDVVWLTGMTKDQIKALPDYNGDVSTLTDDYESRITGLSGRTTTDRDLYDQGRFYADRSGDAAREARLVLHEEQLDIGKRQVQAGEVGVRKTVETEHVRQNVEVIREEVTIERHPVSAADASRFGAADIGEDEIRVPIMREEAVAEKRVVPTEEIVVRKHAVTEQTPIEADVRRERAVVDDAALHARDAGERVVDDRVLDDRVVDDRLAADRLAGRPVADRAENAVERGAHRTANAIDDLKDRVDGNPASRPGPDATDRPGRL